MHCAKGKLKQGHLTMWSYATLIQLYSYYKCILRVGHCSWHARRVCAAQ